MMGESDPQPDDLSASVVDVAREAGAAILKFYHRGFDVHRKVDDSPLTDADLASHELICRRLRSLSPAIPLLSEESGQQVFAARRSWRAYCLVDPLDGTKEYINRNGEFTVNIALVRDHRPVIGVVHVPVSGVTYLGVPGAAAWRIEPDRPLRPIRVRRPCPEQLTVVASRSHVNPRLDAFLEQLDSHQLVSMGSSLKFCLVAEGLADFYPRLGPTSEWDTAAAHAVVVAAGGTVVRLDGTPLEYNRGESLLNPEFLVFADPDCGFVEMFRDYAAGEK